MPESQPETPFKFQSPEGWSLCRKILTKRLPFGPHDFQLRGIAAILDGQDLLAISATGSGKSGYIYMLLHVVLAILEDKSLCPSVKFPPNPAILVIYPTTALEEDQEAKMRKFGLTAKAINADTKGEAEKAGINIWSVAEEQISVILVSPEMLSTPGFGTLIASKKFQDRLFAIGVDEVHLLDSWGKSFRPAFKQIGYMRARFSGRVAMFAMTATLRVGQHTDSVCAFLGFQPGNFLLSRRSNARPDIQLIFRTFNASRASDRFPQLDWILNEPKKTLIFCSGIRYGFKIAIYLWHVDPRNALLHRNIRLFNSLNSTAYNRETLELLEGNVNSKITVATDKLSVGVDVSDFQTVVIIDPKDLDDLWQKGGRVGRDKTKVKDPKVIAYFHTQTMKDAQVFAQMQQDAEEEAEGALAPSKKKRKKSETQKKKDENEVMESAQGGLYPAINHHPRLQEKILVPALRRV